MLVTALVTPFGKNGEGIDVDAWRRLVAFQLDRGADRVLVAGTTGEGTALEPDERQALIRAALEVAQPDQVMVSIGAGRIDRVLVHGRAALDLGVTNLLLVDCPYSGASSSALRIGWYGRAATELTGARLYPYCVPGRTGTEMLPDDLARLRQDHSNVVGVKDASGRLSRMTRVRELCGEDFELLVGDDHMLYDALVDPAIRADGSCSFTANIVPSAMSALVMAGREGRVAPARQLNEKLELLFRLVSVTAEEAVEVNDKTLAVPQRSRNPLPIKTALGLLGIIDEVCRAPLMGMGPKGIAQVRSALRLTARRASDVLADVAHGFNVDLEQLAGGPLTPKISRIVHRVGA